MGKPDFPDPTPAGQTASAQVSQNIGTAIANSYLNNTTQYSPYGSKQYDITGFKRFVDKSDPENPVKYRIPQYSVSENLTPAGQKLFDAQNATKMNLANLATQQSGRLGGLLDRPLNLNNKAVEGRLFDLGRKRLDPMFANQNEDLRTRLANQGIRAGTDAYSREMQTFNQGKNDAYNNLLLSGRGQAVNELMTERNQPLNEIIGIMSGTQLQPMQFSQPNQYGIPTVDQAGIIANVDQMKMQKAQAQAAQSQALFGGMFSMLGGLAPMFSDERLKENVEVIGKTEDGLKVATYNYKGDSKPQMGLIAQDVARKKPDAVRRHASGFLMVDYGKALQQKRAA